jgi:hypothetical protein
MKRKFVEDDVPEEAGLIGKGVKILECYDLSDKYHCTLETLQQTLDDFGVASLDNILASKECQQMQDDMWNFLEHASSKWRIPISRSNSSTWKEMKELWPLHTMLLKQFGIGQAQMLWNLRQNPKVIEPFARLWKTKPSDLLTSFDGASISLPPEETKRGWSTSSPLWLHTDQSYLRNGKECYQAWVTAYPVNKGDATLAVLEGGHKLHQSFREKFRIDAKTKGASKNWFKYNSEHVQFYRQEHKCPLALIQCDAGSMVFWDSRLPHCGFQALREREKPNTRCVGYVCMLPRRLCSKANLKKRIKAFETRRTTSHWPHKPTLNPETPRTYGAPLKDIAPVKAPVLTKIGRRLVGYEV